MTGDECVVCLVCGEKKRTLKQHIAIKHSLTKESYAEMFPGSTLTSVITQNAFNARGKKNGDWIIRRKERGDDLTDYRKKMGEAVSAAILSDPSERNRRSLQLGKNNRTQNAREKSSVTAKKTSTRPEIIAQRSKNLARWRAEHFDDFYEKCIKKMHNCWKSKPELLLLSILQRVEGYEFKRNQVVKSETFTNKSKRKQCDIADKRARVYVEFDGIHHFENKFKERNEQQFSSGQRMDALFDEHVERHGWTLVRISYDHFSYKDGGMFTSESLQKLFEILKTPTPGVHKIGSAYEKRNV